MVNGSEHSNSYEQEDRHYGKETCKSQEKMKSFHWELKLIKNMAKVKRSVARSPSRQSETKKSFLQKKVRFEDQPKDVGNMSNEDNEKKASIGNICDLL